MTNEIENTPLKPAELTHEAEKTPLKPGVLQPCQICRVKQPTTHSGYCFACTWSLARYAPLRMALHLRSFTALKFKPKALLHFAECNPELLYYSFLELENHIIMARRFCEYQMQTPYAQELKERLTGSLPPKLLANASADNYSQELLKNIYTRCHTSQKGLCTVCKQPLTVQQSLDTLIPAHLDHSATGPSQRRLFWESMLTLANAQVVCTQCNQIKGHTEGSALKTLHSFFTGRTGASCNARPRLTAYQFATALPKTLAEANALNFDHTQLPPGAVPQITKALGALLLRVARICNCASDTDVIQFFPQALHLTVGCTSCQQDFVASLPPNLLPHNAAVIHYVSSMTTYQRKITKRNNEKKGQNNE